MEDLKLDFDLNLAHMQYNSILHNQLLINSTVKDIDSKILVTLILKFQEAKGSDSDTSVRLWLSAALLWVEKTEDDPNAFPFSILKVEVAQRLTHLEPSASDFGRSETHSFHTALRRALQL